MTFLPPNYQAPASAGNYMKIQDGENKIRILSKPVLGWEDWVDEKPIRYRFESKPAKSHDPKKPIRHFWAFIVWNYNEEKIQILQVSQATIRKNIEVLCKDSDWGDPYFYDIKIIRTGASTDTEYQVNPLPHKQANATIVKAFNEKKCYLEALFEGADPFSTEWKEFTPGIFDKAETKPAVITKDQIVELKDIFGQCPEAYVQSVMTHLRQSSAAVKSIDELPTDLYERVKTAALRKREENLQLMGMD